MWQKMSQSGERNNNKCIKDRIKENRSSSPWGGWIVLILKMRRFSWLLRLSLPPEMGEMAQTFISEIEWLAVLKCRATGLSTSWNSQSRFRISIWACAHSIKARSCAWHIVYFVILSERSSVKVCHVSLFQDLAASYIYFLLRLPCWI